MAKTYPHLFFNKYTSQPFESPRSGGSKTSYPLRDRKQHAQNLLSQWSQAIKQDKRAFDELQQLGVLPRDGNYVEFESAPGFDLDAHSLELRRQNIRLLKVNSSYDKDDKEIIKASVFFPKDKTDIFEKKLFEYETDNIINGNPKYDKLMRGIDVIRACRVEDLWSDDDHYFPGETPVWCEIWIKCIDKQDNTNTDFVNLAEHFQIETRKNYIVFPELLVLLAKANGAQLRLLFAAFPYIAEIKRHREPASFFINMDNADQSAFIQEFDNRLEVASNPRVSVCVLDTGVNNGIIPLNRVISDEACIAFRPEWRPTDNEGHGTSMCSMVAFGDLTVPLNALTEPSIYCCFNVNYAIESAKILPPKGENDPDLYGDIVKQCIYNEEINYPQINRINCMAVTTVGVENGTPSSFSAAIDQLTFGDDGNRRLMFISAGNIDNDKLLLDYPESNKHEMVQDPGQSWNALTVGAYTQKVLIRDNSFKDYRPVALKGGLSPRSTTSIDWTKWPIKPDIVMEGGNYAYSPDNSYVESVGDLSLLALCHKACRTFSSHADTSAATALASRMAAQINAQYPDAWPETIRGLMVHSACWNDEMLKINSVRERLRIFGYGAPEFHRAIKCVDNSLTLIAECELQPYRKEQSSIRFNEMNFHNLPWPKDTLRQLNDADVELRITLSYFIEPAPGVIWKNNYRYASFGLRFALNNPTESHEDFVKRINKAARDDDEQSISGYRDNHKWLIGSKARGSGSIVSDIWSGSARDLAECNMICIYPIGGWWKDRPYLGKYNNKARYSLIVSLYTPDQSVNIYNPVKVQIENLVKTPIEIKQ